MKPNWPLLAAIRFVLAMIVFDAHLCLVGGDTTISNLLNRSGAVGAFFVISGFSMAHSLSRGSEGFLARRFFRIWPLYIFSLGLALVPFLRGSGFFTWPNIGGRVVMPDAAQMIMNCLMLQPGLTRSMGTNFPMWTLGVEAAFYVVVPFYAQLSTKHRYSVLIASLVFACYANSGGIEMNNRSGAWPYLGLFWLFALGFELFQNRKNTQLQHAALIAPMLAGIGNITIALSMLLVVHQSKITISEKWQKRCLYAGELSYPLYILHDPVMAIIYQQWPQTPLWAYYPAAFLVAIAAYHILDLPVRSWHRKRQQTKLSKNDMVLSPRSTF